MDSKKIKIIYFVDLIIVSIILSYTISASNIFILKGFPYIYVGLRLLLFYNLKRLKNHKNINKRKSD